MVELSLEIGGEACPEADLDTQFNWVLKSAWWLQWSRHGSSDAGLSGMVLWFSDAHLTRGMPVGTRLP